MRPFAWILISFPIYLLVHGKLANYINLTKSTTSKKPAVPASPGP